MNRYCDHCGADNRLADDPVECGHDGTTYCSSGCSRAGCLGCYQEALEDW